MKCNRCGKTNPAEIHTCTPMSLEDKAKEYAKEMFEDDSDERIQDLVDLQESAGALGYSHGYRQALKDIERHLQDAFCIGWNSCSTSENQLDGAERYRKFQNYLKNHQKIIENLGGK